MRLTKKKYWEGFYKEGARNAKLSQQKLGMKVFLKYLVGDRILDLLAPYDNHLLWHSVFPAYLPTSCAGLTIVEIGSAPGEFLVRFAKTFGAEPYGIEYTQHGAECNRLSFLANNFNPDNVIEVDFFSQELLNVYKEKFDIVISRGFIEHFEDVEAVVLRHTELLRPGGLLFVLIPNLRGIYYPWTKMFNPEQIPMHNFEIMEITRFRSLFKKQSLNELRCSYFGTFSFWLFTAPKEARWSNCLIRLLIVLQRGLNFLFRLTFAGRGCESAIFSPNLIFVGRKKAN